MILFVCVGILDKQVKGGENYLVSKKIKNEIESRNIYFRSVGILGR